MRNKPNAPWEIRPDIGPGSLFWRMGAPEEALAKWLAFVLTLGPKERDEYLDHCAAPASWRETVEMSVRARDDLERIMAASQAKK